MKDLYTFDSTKEKALDTYENVRRAYTGFFDEFKIPYVVAEADSGDIGGDLSHEYHFPTPKGEDRIISCTSCSFAINEEEVAKGNFDLRPRIASSEAGADSELAPAPSGQAYSSDEFCSWYAISKDHHYLVEAVYPAKIGPSRMAVINPFLLRQLFPEVDLGVENPMDTFIRFWKAAQAGGGNEPPTVHRIFDFRVPESQFENSTQATTNLFSTLNLTPPIHIKPSTSGDSAPDLLRLETGDQCLKCATGTLKVQTAVELGHTFFLGTRYSKPLRTTIASDTLQLESGPVPMQMGCHGIGVSRLIAAVADILADSIGLNWPRVMAPFEVVIIPYLEYTASAIEIYDFLSSNIDSASPHFENIDAVLDDRDRSFVWKLKDADLIGYPIVVLLGKRWKLNGKAEVRCRRLGVNVEVEAGEVKGLVERLLGKL
jgi:prolyl-tRNA synthetase